MLSLFSLCTFLLPLAGAAQDDPGALSGHLLKTRSSPFDPPTEDVFVTDVGPGLDTGCTFNTDPNHPLIIDVLIGQAVGKVDSNGFLVDPAGLIADGVVPATVDVIMPAFDVDINGGPPPENDNVLLNGESLGTLTGGNEIWKLNSFSVPIRKIKFPPPPPSSACPAPVANRIQINVDTLDTGRWCTAIDWVALVIPIQLKTAFKLEPTAGNKIRVRDYGNSDTIDTIYEQSFDADCNLTTDIGDYTEYPFSGRSGIWFLWFELIPGTARLHATLETCPCNDQITPEVIVKWEIASASLNGVATWSGNEGDIDLTMPAEVGAYDVELTFTVDGKDYPPINRKLFVTKKSPLAPVNPPRLGWYEKATAWASGKRDEDKILEALLGGLYSFGGEKWRYGYDFGAVWRCSWQDLVAADPITCDYADCYVFSDVFENMAATLGVGGLSASEPTGSRGRGFLTAATPSLDPAFPGNAQNVLTSKYDRYVFGIHSLLRKSQYYDATFNDTYSSSTEFITANLTGVRISDTDGKRYWETVEGWKIYDLPGNPYYDSWPNYEYKEPPRRLPLVIAQLTPEKMVSKAMAKTTDIEFTGNATYDLLDDDLDGFAEALIANVEIRLNTTGEYTIIGELQKGGKLIANRPAWESMMLVRTNLDEISGTYMVDLQFSGEQIFRSGEGGPYDLLLEGIAATGFTTTTLATPAYDRTLFGEVDARLTGVAEAAVDAGGDGGFDYVEVTLGLDVRLDGDFRLQGALDKDGQTVVDAGTAVSLGAGAPQVALQFDGAKIRRAGADGPYDGTVNLIDADGHTIDSITFTTAPYTADSFSGLLMPLGTFSDQGVDTNGNGLYDFLRVEFDAGIGEAGDYLVTGMLRGTGSEAAVYTDLQLTAAAGATTISIDFLGPVIHALELDGPYRVEVLVRDPATLADLDAVQLPQATAAYEYTDFDPFGASNLPILLTGNSNDFGVDTDGNSRYDELRVEVEFALTNSDSYEWSARLVDVNNTEIGFYTDQSFLDAGVTGIVFVFDGEKIGNNGVDGPYFVKGLLIFGNSGANLVSVEVAETQAYSATDFEGAGVDLSITKWGSPDPVAAGGNLTYTLMVTNNGPAASTGATVTDPLPAGVTFKSSSDCTEAVGTVTCAIGPLGVGASQSVSFAVTVDPGQTAPLSNTATVTGNEYDPSVGNNNSATVGDVFTRREILALRDGRFHVEVEWRDPRGRSGTGAVAFVQSPAPGPVELRSDDSAVVEFFGGSNWELLGKVLDARAINDRFWFFQAAATNVAFMTTVTDTSCGVTKSYTKPLGSAAPAVTDTDAFAGCDDPAAPSCASDDDTLCLGDDGRFQLEVSWSDFLGRAGVGRQVEIPQAGPAESEDSGLLYFFSNDNWELLVKVLNGCCLNDHFWVFSAATTNVEYTLKVTDTAAGTVKTYTNPLGVSAAALNDTMAFATCDESSRNRCIQVQ
ncbi:MAG: DUF11 domain-containing protein [bacterium]|nr:DUF11 domain-containing protein [bacterium]